MMSRMVQNVVTDISMDVSPMSAAATSASRAAFSWRQATALGRHLSRRLLFFISSSSLLLVDASLDVPDWQSATIIPDWNDFKVQVRAGKRSTNGSAGDRGESMKPH